MLIGISGKIGAGKDTFASALVEYYPRFKIKKFAENLKLISSILSGMPLQDMYTQEGKNKKLPYFGNMTVRELQQRVGTEAVRNNVHKDAWVVATLGNYDPTIHDWIVTDVRFPNEAEFIRGRGGYLVRIDGMRFTGSSTEWKQITRHPSEIALDDYEEWDYRFSNEWNNMDVIERNIQKFLVVLGMDTIE